MVGIETDDTGGQVERGVGGAVAPIDDHGVCIQDARVGEAAVERGCVPLVEGGIRETETDVRRRHVVDRHLRAGGDAGHALIGHGHLNGVRGIAWQAFLVSVIERPETLNAGVQLKRGRRRTITPVNEHLVRILNARVDEGTRKGNRVALVDRGGTQL